MNNPKVILLFILTDRLKKSFKQKGPQRNTHSFILPSDTKTIREKSHNKGKFPPEKAAK